MASSPWSVHYGGMEGRGSIPALTPPLLSSLVPILLPKPAMFVSLQPRFGQEISSLQYFLHHHHLHHHHHHLLLDMQQHTSSRSSLIANILRSLKNRSSANKCRMTYRKNGGCRGWWGERESGREARLRESWETPASKPGNVASLLKGDKH